MMMVMMMVMMVVMPRRGRRLGMAVLLMAVLPLGLQLQGNVADAVLPQLLTNSLLDLVGVLVGYDVHGGIVILPVHAPDVYVVYPKHSGDFTQMLLNFVNSNTVRRFFKKQL